MDIIEFFKAIILGIVEGITEWLPVSSTGHMILVDEFLKLDVSPAFKEMFLVVIQLGSILAVVVFYFQKLIPFTVQKGLKLKPNVVSMWMKIIVSCMPAAIVGVLWDDVFHANFYNYQTVAVMLIIFGILFILVERWNKGRDPKVNDISDLTYKTVIIIGLFQVIAAIFPGTSRSGATIVGALLLGVSRTTAAEFTFFLAVPVMFGASALKLVGFGFDFTGYEILILAAGMIAAFITSLFVIGFLMNYIKKHDFTVFGWYRIILGVIVLLYFGFIG